MIKTVHGCPLCDGGKKIEEIKQDFNKPIVTIDCTKCKTVFMINGYDEPQNN